MPPPVAIYLATPEYLAAFQAFQRAAQGGAAAVEPAAEQFGALSRARPGDPLSLAYAGSATTLRATTTLLPWRKMSCAEDGLAQRVRVRVQKALQAAGLAEHAGHRQDALSGGQRQRRSLVTLGIAELGTAAILLAGVFALYTYQSLAESAAPTTSHLIIGRPPLSARPASSSCAPCSTASAQVRHVSSAVRDEAGKLLLNLRGRPERLVVSRLNAHLFKGM